jgi:glycosyltransferase involved in cell wall biosynthesis
MRIGIDAHCLGQQKTGNETYTYNLVKHLALLESEGMDYVIYLSAKANGRTGTFSGPRSRTKLIRPESPYLRIPIGFAMQTRTEKLDIFHAQYFLPHHLQCRTVLTVHDILYERYPQFFTRMDLFRNKIGIRESCRRADHIITVSESSKRDLIEIYGLNPSRITVTYHGLEDGYRPIDQGDAKQHLACKYGLHGDFILYVGAIQPRKNIPRLLSAFAELKRKLGIPHKLVIVGPKSWLASQAFRTIEKHPYRRDVIVTGYVPPEDLPYFYNAATVFAYVPICEGFGLPVLEAIACGTPTITSRGSSLEEVAGGAAVLVDALDVSSIASAIESVLSDPDLRARLRSLGLARSSQFSCQEMAERTQAVYRQVMS